GRRWRRSWAPMCRVQPRAGRRGWRGWWRRWCGWCSRGLLGGGLGADAAAVAGERARLVAADLLTDGADAIAEVVVLGLVGDLTQRFGSAELPPLRRRAEGRGDDRAGVAE